MFAAAPDSSLIYTDGNKIMRAYMSKDPKHNQWSLAEGEYGQWKMKWLTEQLAGDKSPAKFGEEVEVCATEPLCMTGCLGLWEGIQSASSDDCNQVWRDYSC